MKYRKGKWPGKVQFTRELFDKQGGRCAICLTRDPKGGWHLDHNHETKEIRGVLCARCNYVVGGLENPFANSAIEYLLEHGRSDLPAPPSVPILSWNLTREENERLYRKLTEPLHAR